MYYMPAPLSLGHWMGDSSSKPNAMDEDENGKGYPKPCQREIRCRTGAEAPVNLGFCGKQDGSVIMGFVVKSHVFLYDMKFK